MVLGVYCDLFGCGCFNCVDVVCLLWFVWLVGLLVLVVGCRFAGLWWV